MLFPAVLMNILNSKVCLKGEWSIGHGMLRAARSMALLLLCGLVGNIYLNVRVAIICFKICQQRICFATDVSAAYIDYHFCPLFCILSSRIKSRVTGPLIIFINGSLSLMSMLTAWFCFIFLAGEVPDTIIPATFCI